MFSLNIISLFLALTHLTITKPIAAKPIAAKPLTKKGSTGSIYGRNYTATELPADELSIVLYAFANFQLTGEVFSSDTWADIQKHYPGDSWNDVGNNVYGSVKQLYLQKKANRNLRVILSIGGWTYSQTSGFSTAAGNETSRAIFAKTAVALVKDWEFDGIDIDWEYPASDADAENFVLLLQAVREELDVYAAQYAPDYHFLLTVASPAGPENCKMLSLGAMAGVIDFFNFMGYDYSGVWSSYASHQANLYPNSDSPNTTPYSTDVAITDYLAAGVERSQILLGMPVYGRAFENTAGLGYTYSGIGMGSWENGIWDYKVLPHGNATVFIDNVAGATYSYDTATTELISYDTAHCIKRKVRYIHDQGLGGAMFWEASADRNDSQSLIGTSYRTLGGLDTTENLLDYPASQYANMAAGMPS